MKHKVALKKNDKGWSQSQTEDEALANIGDAIREYLAVRDDLLRDGDIREVEVTG